MPQQHAEQVAQLIEVGQHIQPAIEVRRPDPITHVAQGREVLDREANGVEHGDLPFVLTCIVPQMRCGQSAFSLPSVAWSLR